jgi:hypothetical protein
MSIGCSDSVTVRLKRGRGMSSAVEKAMLPESEVPLIQNSALVVVGATNRKIPIKTAIVFILDIFFM